MSTKAKIQNDYTPTTEAIRHAVASLRARLGEPRPIEPESFDRWLEQVKAEAWDECCYETMGQGTAQIPDNPHRQEMK